MVGRCIWDLDQVVVSRKGFACMIESVGLLGMHCVAFGVKILSSLREMDGCGYRDWIVLLVQWQIHAVLSWRLYWGCGWKWSGGGDADMVGCNQTLTPVLSLTVLALKGWKAASYSFSLDLKLKHYGVFGLPFFKLQKCSNNWYSYMLNSISPDTNLSFHPEHKHNFFHFLVIFSCHCVLLVMRHLSLKWCKRNSLLKIIPMLIVMHIHTRLMWFLPCNHFWFLCWWFGLALVYREREGFILAGERWVGE